MRSLGYICQVSQSSVCKKPRVIDPGLFDFESCLPLMAPDYFFGAALVIGSLEGVLM